MANRFKQSIESVHPTESVTDLKTAGISPVSEAKELPVEKEEAVTAKLQAEVNISQKKDDEIPAAPEVQPTDVHTEESKNRNYQDVKVNQNSIASPTNIRSDNQSYAEISGLQAQLEKADSTQKNIPNMFTRKGESKSIRKSLVLRPSSVKIAEDYCAQNGGSFNELIQILLDNFIEEYGL